MAEIDPWDRHLEAVTQKLDEMTHGKLRGRVTLQQDDGWIAEFRGAGRSLTVQVGHPAGHAAMPGDYGRAVIYGCDFIPIGNEGKPAAFGKTLTLREGYSWDEQAIREVVLETLGIIRYVLGVSRADDMTFYDHSRQGPVSLARQTVQRRKRR